MTVKMHLSNGPLAAVEGSGATFKRFCAGAMALYNFPGMCIHILEDKLFLGCEMY